MQRHGGVYLLSEATVIIKDVSLQQRVCECVHYRARRKRGTEYPTALKTRLERLRKGPNMEFSQRNLCVAVTGHGDPQIVLLNQACAVANKRTKTLECAEGG